MRATAFRDVVIGYLFGTNAAADAFFVAFRLPNLLRRFAAEGAMNVAFVPVFSDDFLVTLRDDRTLRRVSAIDPLNLVGVILPGDKQPAQAGKGTLYVDGLPQAPDAFCQEAAVARSLRSAPLQG